MERINRIKAVLAETERTGKWLAEQQRCRSGVLIPANPIFTL